MLTRPLDLSYLGDRDYIDVSSIISSFWKALSPQTTQSSVGNIHFKILRPIRNQCELVYAENQWPSIGNVEPRVKLKWTSNNRTHLGYFLETNTLLTARRTESSWKLEDHLEIRENVVIIKKAFQEDCIYNLMKAGKYIIQHQSHHAPRVAEFIFNQLYSSNDIRGCVLKYEPLKKIRKDQVFIRLVCFKNDNIFGNVYVKLLQ